MAVNIPQIQRGKGVSQDSIGRVQVDTGTGLNAYLKETEAIGNVVSKTAQTYVDYKIKAESKAAQDAEDLKIKSLTNTAKVELNSAKDKFLVVPKVGDDHTEGYESTLDSFREIKDKYLKEVPVGSSLHTRLKQELENDMVSTTTSINSEYYRSNEIRKTKEDEKELDNIVRYDLKDAAAYFNPKDPETIKKFDDALNKIRNNINKSDILSGTAQETKDGQPIYSQTSLAKADKFVGNAVQVGVDNLLAIGDIKKAKALYKHYESLINPEDTKKLNEIFTKADKEEQYKGYVNKFAKLPEDIGVQAISLQVPEDLQPEVQERYAKEKVRQAEKRNRVSRATEILLKDLINKDNLKGQTVEQFYNNPKVQIALKNKTLTPEDRKSIENELGARNKTGDAVQFVELSEAYKNGEMKTWSIDELKRKGVNLNQKEWNTIEKYHQKATGVIKGGPSEKTRNAVRSKTLNLLTLSGAVFPFSDTPTKLTIKGKLKKANDVMPWIEDEIEKLPDTEMTASELNSAVNEIYRQAYDKFKVNKEVKPKFGDIITSKIKGVFSSEPALTEEERKQKIKDRFNK